MSDKLKNKLKFTEVQNQIDNLKNIDHEFGNIKDKAFDIDAHKAKVQAAGVTVKDKLLTNLKGSLAIALLGILAQILFPWWTIAIVGAWVGYWFADTPSRSFLYGFISMFLVWSIYAGYQSAANEGIVANAISGLLGGKVSGTQLIYVTGLIGGLVTGLATMTGTQLRSVLNK
ncbi:MAG: hypothetical protein JNL70_17940 [Saprospiraceae bacterium]|nr:hypothetical protein [Saprospiraceae bacterium]